MYNVHRIIQGVHDVDTRKLVHLIALVEEKNFSRAALRVNLTQSALTRSIQTLETELNVRLVERNTNNVALTPAGKKVFQMAKDIVSNLLSMSQELEYIRSGTGGCINMGIGPFPAATFIPELVADVMSEKINVRFNTIVNNWRNLLKSLNNDEVDFFISDTRDVPRDGRYEIVPLTNQFLSFYVGKKHTLYNQEVTDRKTLSQFPLISVSLPEILKSMIKEFVGCHKNKDCISLYCDSPTMLEKIAIKTNSVMITSHMSLIEKGSIDVFRELKFEETRNFLFAEIGICFLKDKPLSPINDFFISKVLSKFSTNNI